MARSKNGEAISEAGRTPSALRYLRKFIQDAESRGSLDEWRRGRAVLGYIKGLRVVDIAQEVGKSRGSVNRWLQWYEAAGVNGLFTGKAPGPAPLLSEKQRLELVGLVEGGPIAAGYQSGVWTGPMIGDLIEERFGVRYHTHYVPRLLHQLGFSVQRPRKRLARANAEAQDVWIKKTFPKIKKKPSGAAVS